MVSLLAIDTRIKLLLFLLINFMVFGLKDFVLGSVCFSFICILSCLMGQKKIVLKYIVFYVVIAAIQQLCIYLPQAIETILSIFTLFIRVMIPVVLFASTFIATTKVSELIAAMYSLKIPRSITITFAMVLRFFPTFSEEIHNIYDAMKLRGIALSWKNVFTRPMLILEAITIPIVMRSASIAEELSASAVTRGIDNPAQRTSFIQLKVHAKDWMVLCFFLVAFVVLFFCKYQIYGRIWLVAVDDRGNGVQQGGSHRCSCLNSQCLVHQIHGRRSHAIQLTDFFLDLC